MLPLALLMTGLGASAEIAPSASLSASNELTRLKGIYTSTLASIEQKYRVLETNATARYRQNLDGLEKTCQQKGDLTALMAIRDEKARFTGEQGTPGPEVAEDPAELKNFKVAMRALVSEMDAQKNKELGALITVYLTRLEALQRDLTKQGMIAEALMIRAEADRVKPEQDGSAPLLQPATRPFPPEDQREGPETQTPAAPPVTKPAASSTVPPSSQQKVDLLSLVDPAVDGVLGVWAKKGASLYSSRDEMPKQLDTIVEIPYFPPEEYNFRGHFEPKSGLNRIVLFLSSKGETRHLVLAEGQRTFQKDPRARIEFNAGKKYPRQPVASATLVTGGRGIRSFV